MTRIARVGLLIAVAAIGGVMVLAHRSATVLHKFRSEDPVVWEGAIAAFEHADRKSPPPLGAVVFLGSFGISGWDSIDSDLAPLSAVRRGFGGAKVRDILYYLERLVVPLAPRAVVVDAGGNDLFEAAGSEPKTPEQVAATCREIAAALRALLPDASLYFVEQHPPILDAEKRDPFSRLNVRVAAMASELTGVAWVEVNEALYAADGRLKPEYLSGDRVHLTPAGYAAWSAPIREHLLRDLADPGA